MSGGRKHRGRSRGLTLIEVLAATVLLAMIVGAVLPALRRAGDVASAAEPAVAFAQFRNAVDQLMSDPTIAVAADTNGAAPRSMPWPGGAPDRPSIDIQYLGAASGDETTRGWITFTCERWTIVRWIDHEQDDESKENEHAARPDDA